MGLLDGKLPILNLIQHVRHAEEWSVQSNYLGHKAIRLCVSPEVAAAVVAAGSQGPTVVIPNGVDVPICEKTPGRHRAVDLLIAGLKQPGLAARAAEALTAPGRSLEILTEHVSRDAFLAGMRRARGTLFLPNEEEGFYLPALEGMAAGAIVVCPDCVGNRSFCLTGVTAFRPDYEFEALVRATETALRLPESEAQRMLANGRDMARRHSLDAEREAFGRVLADLDTLWATA